MSDGVNRKANFRRVLGIGMTCLSLVFLYPAIFVTSWEVDISHDTISAKFPGLNKQMNTWGFIEIAWFPPANKSQDLDDSPGFLAVIGRLGLGLMVYAFSVVIPHVKIMLLHQSTRCLLISNPST